MAQQQKMTAEQVAAVRTLIEYARAKFNIKPKQIREDVGLKEKDLWNFYHGKNHQVGWQVYDYLRALYGSRRGELDSWILPVYSFLYSDADQGAQNVELEEELYAHAAEAPKLISAFCSNYAGAYSFTRFAAQRNYNLKSDDPDYELVRGSFTIVPPSQEGELPRFRSYCRRRNDAFDVPPYREEGIIVPYRDCFYCIGFESDTRYPVFIVARLRNFKIKTYFLALVMRRSVNDTIFSSRIVFTRAGEGTNPESLSEIAYFNRDQLSYLFQDQLSGAFLNMRAFEKLLRNKIDRKGRSVLFLEPPDFE